VGGGDTVRGGRARDVNVVVVETDEATITKAFRRGVVVVHGDERVLEVLR
jgi:hypothetical protein